MSREKGAGRVAEKRSARHKDVINRLSCVTNGEMIAILAILTKGDYEAPFLINISIGRRKKRLTVSVLLDMRYWLSVVIDY